MIILLYVLEIPKPASLEGFSPALAGLCHIPSCPCQEHILGLRLQCVNQLLWELPTVGVMNAEREVAAGPVYLFRVSSFICCGKSNPSQHDTRGSSGRVKRCSGGVIVTALG